MDSPLFTHAGVQGMSAAQFLLMLLLVPFAYGLAASLIAFYSGRSLVKANYRGAGSRRSTGPAARFSCRRSRHCLERAARRA